MKKIGIFLFMLSTFTLFSQDYEPSQITYNFQGNINYYLSGDSSYFKQNNFILGWAWSCGKKMSEALMDNQGHVGDNFSKSVIKDSTNLVICANGIYDAGSGLTGSNSQSMCYSPVLRITNDEGIINNPKHYIFGFKHINGEPIVSNDVSLKLRTIGLGYISYTVPVLDSAWADNYLYWYSLGTAPPAYAPDINTTNMLFVINLKRSNPSDNTLDTAKVLKIKLPLTISGTTSYIQFDSIPSGIPNDTFHIRTSLRGNNYRGVARKYTQTGTGTREFYITRNMLPRDTGNITITAHRSERAHV